MLKMFSVPVPLEILSCDARHLKQIILHFPFASERVPFRL